MATDKFIPGDLVLITGLVKYPGYWPGQISQIVSKNWRNVEYFGGGEEIGKAHVQVIRDYDEATKDDLEEFIPKKKMDKDPVLKQAVKQINQKLTGKKMKIRGVGIATISEGKKMSDKKETAGKQKSQKTSEKKEMTAAINETRKTRGKSFIGTNNETKKTTVKGELAKKKTAEKKTFIGIRNKTKRIPAINKLISTTKEKDRKKTSAGRLRAGESDVQGSDGLTNDYPEYELQIIDMPKLKSGAAFNETSGKKSEPLKLVASNIYRTCACLELCQADSCACVGYLEECKESCQCGDSCANTGLTVGEGKRLFLAASDVHGTGCFTDEDIKEGEFVGEYVGEIVSKVDAARKRNQSEFLFTTGDKNFVIDASRFGSKLTRMNHKDDKSGENCEFRLKRVRGAWRVGVWALQHISKGVELFANYGEYYWKHLNKP